MCKELDRPENSLVEVSIAKQLVRSSVSVALNYGEARGAESVKDYIHKIRIALKELNETKLGLRILLSVKPTRKEQLTPLITEAGELTGILIGCIRTATKKL